MFSFGFDPFWGIFPLFAPYYAIFRRKPLPSPKIFLCCSVKMKNSKWDKTSNALFSEGMLIFVSQCLEKAAQKMKGIFRFGARRIFSVRSLPLCLRGTHRSYLLALTQGGGAKCHLDTGAIHLCVCWSVTRSARDATCMLGSVAHNQNLGEVW